MATVLILFALTCLALHLAGTGLALSALTRPKPRNARSDHPGVTILRPVCGLEHGLERTLTTSFEIDYPAYEILFCVARPDDAAVPLIQRLIADHPAVPARLLIGDDRVSANPKLNNCVKGWQAATYPLVLMSDSNVLLPPDTLTRLLDQWTPGTGLVSAPPIGVEPQGLWARLECAFLNTFQARWQLAAARMDQGYAQGKMLLWDRELLNRNGGIAALGAEMAEDVASTKLVRAAGHHVRLPGQFFEQPIGPRGFAAVWSRQVRWARVRRLGFPWLFLPEVLAGAALPVLALVASGAPWLAVTGFALLWYGAEYLLAQRGNWPRTPADIATWALRDALLAPLWLACWTSSKFEWRGNAMTAAQVSEATRLGQS